MKPGSTKSGDAILRSFLNDDQASFASSGQWLACSTLYEPLAVYHYIGTERLPSAHLKPVATQQEPSLQWNDRASALLFRS